MGSVGGQPRGQGKALAYQGETDAARAAADASLEAASELGASYASIGYLALGIAALAAGDVATARDASEAVWQHMSLCAGLRGTMRTCNAQAALADGDLIAARRWADDAVATATGWYLMWR